MTTDIRAALEGLVDAVNYGHTSELIAAMKAARLALAAEPNVPKMVEPAGWEVTTLVGCLHDLARSDWLSDETADILTRAADLLERLAPQPVPEG